MTEEQKEERLLAIDNEIEQLKSKLNVVEGRKTEVYTRIVGYYRSYSRWNKGKAEEFKNRKTYNVPLGVMA